MRFPANGQPYYAGWLAGNDITPAEARELEKIALHSLVPAERGLIIVLLTRLAMHFWAPDRDEKQWKIIIEDYARDLDDYPADILEAGIVIYRRTGKWWPKVSELLTIVEPLLLERKRQFARLRAHGKGWPR